MARQGKRFWRRRMAERLAKRKRRIEGRNDDEATYEEIEEAYRLVNRICRLANDNERNTERDNDSYRHANKWRAAKLDRIEERWVEREKEIAELFKPYGCYIDWPGIYPSINADEGGTIDIWEMW